MNQKGISVIALIILVILGGFIFVVFYIPYLSFQKYNDYSSLQQNAINQKTEYDQKKLSVIPDSTNSGSLENAKVYTNQEGRYSIQYPGSYTIEETNSLNTEVGKQLAIKPVDQSLNFIIYVDFTPVPNSESAQQIMEKASACDSQNAQKGEAKLKEKELNLGAYNWKVYENSLCGQFSAANFYLSANDKVYNISVASTEEYTLHKPQVEKILSTFKVIN